MLQRSKIGMVYKKNVKFTKHHWTSNNWIKLERASKWLGGRNLIVAWKINIDHIDECFFELTPCNAQIWNLTHNGKRFIHKVYTLENDFPCYLFRWMFSNEWNELWKRNGMLYNSQLNDFYTFCYPLRKSHESNLTEVPNSMKSWKWLFEYEIN